MSVQRHQRVSSNWKGQRRLLKPTANLKEVVVHQWAAAMLSPVFPTYCHLTGPDGWKLAEPSTWFFTAPPRDTFHFITATGKYRVAAELPRNSPSAPTSALSVRRIEWARGTGGPTPDEDWSPVDVFMSVRHILRILPRTLPTKNALRLTKR